MDGLECGGFFFYSNFDSGNLYRVEQLFFDEPVVTGSTFTGKNDVPNYEFNLWTKPDCAGTEYENGNRTWFYFAVRGNQPSALLKFNLVDLNKQAKLYSQGMGPVYRILPGKVHWERICDKPTFNNEKNVFTLSFKCKMPENVNNMLYLAFTYPHSYNDIQHRLDSMEGRIRAEQLASKDDIYFIRERVINSLEGRRMDLLTISSFHNISNEREPRLKNLFPDMHVPRSYRFTGKKIIFISSRVHPGETPASFVFNGLLNLLLSRDDLVAINLRRNYVFKMIPCLNPDGVANGHYRTDTRGVNLNRVYLNPNLAEHPTIYAARSLIRYCHYGFEKDDNQREDPEAAVKLSTDVSHMSLEEKNKNSYWCWKCKANVLNVEETMPGISSIIPTFSVNNSTEAFCRNCGEKLHVESQLPQGDCATKFESGLFLYLDMHGHASKKGIFMYGNHFDDLESNIKCMLLPKIMSLNNHNFHFTACNFTERNMYLKDKRDGMSKEGSGRVAVFKLTGLIQSYTLECNYNTGRLVNILPPTIKETAKSIQTLLVPPKYTPQVFEEVGRAIGSSILDLSAQNPYTRLPHSEYHSLNGLKEWLRVHCANDIGEMRTSSPHKIKIKHTSSLQAQGKAARSVILKSRSLSKYAPKKLNLKQLRFPNKKEKSSAEEVLNSPEPGCSYITNPSASTSRISTIKGSKSLTMRPRGKKDANLSIEKRRPSTCSGVNHITKNIQNTALIVKNKLKADKKDNTKKPDEEQRPMKVTEICFIKDTEGKKVIAKYQNDGNTDDDNLVVSWNAGNTNPQVFTHKSRLPAFLTNPTADKKTAVRVHNFQKTNPPFNKVKRNKRIFKRLVTAVEVNKKIKKSKILKKKSRKVSSAHN